MIKPSDPVYAEWLEYLANNTLSGSLGNYPLLQSALAEQGCYLDLNIPCRFIYPLANYLVFTLKNSGVW